MNTPKSAKNLFRRWALPVGLSVAGLGLAAVGVVLIVKYLKKTEVDEDAEVENFDVVKNRPFFY